MSLTFSLTVRRKILYDIIKNHKNDDKKSKNQSVMNYLIETYEINDKTLEIAVYKKLSQKFLSKFYERFERIKRRNRYDTFEDSNSTWLVGDLRIEVKYSDLKKKKDKKK